MDRHSQSLRIAESVLASFPSGRILMWVRAHFLFLWLRRREKRSPRISRVQIGVQPESGRLPEVVYPADSG